MTNTDNITINARKFDREIHRSWKCKLLEENDDYYIFAGKFDSVIEHADLGLIRPDTVSYEYYWKREFYNIFKFFEPEGNFRNFYCNLNLPPTFSNDTLDYIDLDIDILVWNDFSFKILDLDEYETNTKKFNYPIEIQKQVSKTIDDLIKKIETRAFPFNSIT